MGLWEFVRRPQAALVADIGLAKETCDTMDSAHSALLQLPPEIIDQILSYLECPSLVSLSRASRLLKEHAENDILWENLLRAQLPQPDFPEQSRLSGSYRSLYISHHPYWFLPRQRLWFSDEALTGKLILVRFDPRRGCIEGYRLVADREEPDNLIWSYSPDVTIHTFKPTPRLMLGDPVLKLEQDPVSERKRQGWWDGEIKMPMAATTSHGVFSSFFLSRAIPDHSVDRRMALWPPMSIPDMPRVRSSSHDNFQGWGHKPQKLNEISDTTFRLRKWIQFSVGGAYFGVRMGDEVSTWSTLNAELYTPTAKKPYQGIFIGDYAGHGCEFILITQTKQAPALPPQPAESHYYDTRTMRLMTSDRPNSPSGGDRNLTEEDDIYSGSLEAIKLTGDPHIPRGEHTFIADDIGSAGFIRNADEEPFHGARVVKCRGHVARRGYTDGKGIILLRLLPMHC